ncbi:hypothetical protein MODO_0240 [Myroides odoratimimus]|uniref:Uncharacterized protein n=1 Tax=Myroides odoratimimus CCUG 10230 TaxID=883150 RepID=A0ABN0ED04_9FLAO|nr:MULTISPECIES: hypothetical protein [Myroides]AJA68685.1 hypothetical protein MYRA21_1530 [Myroides sp. A21]EHO11160.1 hypothetical protein HMPREF9712_00817 [Myroides odoratimimus CCUG 10230]MDM1083842.1 hypothetical protein [Myroides odoratimimus]MDM1455491.1 hypothetical protein [Myroides odoratimimus]STZ47075.1 Uncharacterised protein [Myroides odoratimimus]
MTLKIGDVVFYKTHPYTANDQEIKIAMYADYTTPIMVVNKKGEGEKFNTKTGRKAGEFVECIYYNSRDGKYVSKRMNAEELIKCGDSYVRKEESRSFLKELGSECTTIEEVRKNIEEKYIYKQVVLKSVDLELFKHKINRTKENGDLVETNHLEFLPPVMTVIGCKFIDEKDKFCSHTGGPAIELKCKWYNSQSKTFSEESFRIENLYLIDLKIEGITNDLLSEYKEQIESNSFNLIELKKPLVLEGTDGLSVKYSLLQIESIVYKHYFYEALVYSLLKNSKESILINKKIKEIKDGVLWGTSYPDYAYKGYLSGITSYPIRENEYYQISYNDKMDRFTKRVIKIKDIFFVIENEKKEALFENLGWLNDDISAADNEVKEFIDSSNLFFINSFGNSNVTISKDKGEVGISVSSKLIKDKNIVILLETNCLLKNGAIRHFRLDGISEIRAINNGVDLFENGVIPENEV